MGEGNRNRSTDSFSPGPCIDSRSDRGTVRECRLGLSWLRGNIVIKEAVPRWE